MEATAHQVHNGLTKDAPTPEKTIWEEITWGPIIAYTKNNIRHLILTTNGYDTNAQNAKTLTWATASYSATAGKEGNPPTYR